MGWGDSAKADNGSIILQGQSSLTQIFAEPTPATKAAMQQWVDGAKKALPNFVVLDEALWWAECSYSNLIRDIAVALSKRFEIDYHRAVRMAEQVVTTPKNPEQWMRANGIHPPQPRQQWMPHKMSQYVFAAKLQRQTCLRNI